MVIELRPETEELLKSELANGHFRTVDEMILQAIRSRSGVAKSPVTDQAELPDLMRPPLPTGKQRAEAFVALVQSLTSSGVYLADDSRESIYGEHP